MMKYLLILSLAFYVLSAQAQNDKITLKSGAVIRGMVSEIADGDSIRIKLKEGEISMPVVVVEEIRYRKRNGEKKDTYRDLSYTRGSYFTVKGGMILGNHSYEDPLKGFLLLEGMYEYHHHPLLNLGIGSGVNLYDKYVVSPLYLHYQVALSKKSRSIYFFGQAGHGFAFSNGTAVDIDDVKSGRLLAGGIGYQKSSGNGLIKYQVGFQSQRITEYWKPMTIWSWPTWYENFVSRRRNMDRVILSVSYSF